MNDGLPECDHVLYSLQRLISAWEKVGDRLGGEKRDVAYANASDTRDAARMIRVLQQKLQGETEP